MSSRHEEHGNSQCHCSKSATASQSFDELEFERGIWTVAIDNDEAKLRSLIAKGHLHDKDRSGYTALHYAARNGHMSICLILLDSGIGIDETTHGGATALHRAAMMGHTRIVELLLQRKANPILQDSDGKTALHRAVEGNHFETCQILFQHNSTPATIRDNKGNTPLGLISDTSPQYQRLKTLFSV
ncbi:ankyrin repeat domain-containing protein 39-like [Toxorhynchites rutilus septentrionalis]|uniref:ankyrin repeat domain-containing protein 39-like n=1 Tax=Toxorhynchites rutilus septentrionalis TaxID=329112 RepID=UPI0024783B9C|nr:ankyrin repeat domain-containing protein 39-like [Toxorhynchites rutilus septentrionalis]